MGFIILDKIVWANCQKNHIKIPFSELTTDPVLTLEFSLAFCVKSTKYFITQNLPLIKHSFRYLPTNFQGSNSI